MSITERYQDRGPLGVGGASAVHAAFDTVLNREVAIKFLAGGARRNQAARLRFRQEVDIVTGLSSPHIMPILDTGEGTNGTPYAVMPLASGGDLGKEIQRQGSLGIEAALSVGAQVGQALDVVHRAGLVHGDVKPSNVLLRNREDTAHIYLSDFGNAIRPGDGVGRPTGSLPYLAPEVLAGQLPTPSSDLYALGCLLYECLTGRPPYTGSPHQVAMAHAHGALPTLPGKQARVTALNRVLARLLAKQPRDRYPSADAAARELRGVQGGGFVTARSRSRLWWLAPLAGVVAATSWQLFAPEEKGASTVGAAGDSKTAVVGDLNGDGYGDIEWTYTSSGDDPKVHVITMESSGKTLKARLQEPKLTDRPFVAGTFGKRGAWQTVSTDEVRESSKAVSLGKDDSLQTLAIDVRGSGQDELARAVLGPGQTEGKLVASSVTEGALGRPREVATLPGLAADAVLVAANVDAQAGDELIAWTPGKNNASTGRIQAYKIAGGTIEPTSASLELPEPIAAIAVADVEGDGVDDLVGVRHGSKGLVLELLNWRGTGLERTTFNLDVIPSSPVLRNFELRVTGTDVDGDGRTDVAILASNRNVDFELGVARSTPSGFATWRHIRQGCGSDSCGDQRPFGVRLVNPAPSAFMEDG